MARQDLQLTTLTRAQADHFIEHGYVVIPDCLDPELARRWTDRAYGRLAYDAGDPATWREEIDQSWQAPSAAVGGWHKDGSYFRHFLDSREQAQLIVLLWSDVAARGGGTFIAPDSVPVVARYLAQRPAGAGPGEFGDLVHECREFAELTGPCGTLAILHPFMLHASSHNHSGRPRFMSNPPLVLREPMRLQRSDPGAYSLLERATLHALGVDHYEFRPTAPRESYWQVRQTG